MHVNHRFFKYNFSRYFKVTSHAHWIVHLLPYWEFAIMSAVAFLKFVQWCQDDARIIRISMHRYLAVLYNYALISTFILHRKLVVEHGVHFYTTVSFYSVSHSLEYYIASVFRKPLRLDVIRIYHRACQYTILERCFDFPPSKFISDIHMHESFTHRILQILEPHNTCDHWMSIADR